MWSGSDAAFQGGGAGVSNVAPASTPVIGHLQIVIGSVTITRGTGIVGEPGVGLPIYEGDILKTGDDGVVAVTLADGTTFHLHANGHMVLDEFKCGTKKSSNSALIRIVKGVFGLVAGKLAADGRLRIDTPFGQLRNNAPAVGIGSVTLAAFTFALIRELKADSANVAYLDNGTIDYKDLKHGVFEIVTKGDHPQVIIVDDPTQTIVIQHHGSSYSVAEVQNSPLEMAQYQVAYNHVYSNYVAGQQDPFIQQWQHANAQPQSNPGGTGSSTSAALLSGSTLNNSPPPANGGPSGPTINTHVSGGSSSGSSTSSGPGALLPTPTAFWLYDANGNWNSTTGWSDAPWAPVYGDTGVFQNIIIDNGTGNSGSIFVVITIDSGMADAGPSSTAVADLTLDTDTTLLITSDSTGVGSLTVFGTLDNSGLVQVNDAGSTLTLNGPVINEAGPGIQAIQPGATIYFTDSTPPAPGGYAVDNFGNITAANTGAGAGIFFEQTTVKNEAGALIIAEDGASITFDGGAGSIFQNSGAVQVQGGSTMTFELGMVVDNSSTITVGTGSTVNTLTLTSTTLTNTGAVTVEGQSLLLLNGADSITGAGSITVASKATLTAVGTDSISGGTLVNSGSLNDLGNLTLASEDVTNNGAVTVGSGSTADALTVTGTTLINTGTFTVGTLSTLALDDGTLTNSGAVNADGTASVTNETVTNSTSGTITIGTGSAAASLTMTSSTVSNAGSITVDEKSLLLLNGADNITGAGSITNDALGTFTLTGTDSIGGGTLANSGALNADGTVSVTNETVTNNASGTITLGTGTAADTLTLTGTTVNNTGAMTVEGQSLLLLNGGDGISGTGSITVDALATFTLSGTDSISGGGTMTNFGTVNADGTVTFDDLTVSNENVISVAGSLTLDDGTAVTNGAGDIITVSGALTLDGKGSIIDGNLINTGTVNAGGPGNVIDGVTVTNDTVIDVSSGGQLTLDGGTLVTNTGGNITVAGTLILDVATISGDTITSTGNVNVTGDSTIEALSLIGGNLSVAGGTTLTVAEVVTFSGVTGTDDGTIIVSPTLTLVGTDSISGPGKLVNTGTVNADGTVTFDGGLMVSNEDVISVAGALTVAGGATITNTAAGDLVTVSGALTLGGDGSIVDGKLINTGTVNAGGAGNVLDGVTVTNDNVIDVFSGGQLTLDGGTLVTNTGGNITVAGTLILDVATISGDTITSTGNVNVTGDSTIEALSLIGGDLSVAGGTTLTLAEVVTFSGVTGTDDGTIIVSPTLTLIGTDSISGPGKLINTGTINADGTVTFDGGLMVSNEDVISVAGALTVDGGATITNTAAGDLVTVSGALTLGGDGSIVDGKLINTGTVNAGGAGNVLDGVTVTNDNVIDVFSGGQLTLDGGTLVTNTGGNITVAGTLILDVATISGDTITSSGNVNVTGDSTIEALSLIGGDLSVAGGTTLTVAEAVTFSGVTAIDDSTGFDPNPAGFEVISGAVLTLDDGTQINGNGTGTMAIESGAQLAITSATGATLDGVIVDDDTTTTSPPGVDVALGAVLTLDGGTQIWGGPAAAPGTLTIESTGQLAITGNATLDGVIVADDNSSATTPGIDVVSLLTLNDGTQINGYGTGTLTVESTGELSITVGKGADGATPGGATLNGVVVIDDNSTGAGIYVTSDATLTLTGLDSITGGTLSNAGNLTDEGNVTIGNLALTQSGNGTFTVDATDALTLTGTDSFTGGDLRNAGNITESGGNTSVTFDDEKVNDTGGVFTVLSGDNTLKLVDTNFYGGGTGTLSIAPGDTLILDNAHISGVKLIDTGVHVEVIGNSSINSVHNVIYGDITVYATKTLVVDDSLLIATVTNQGSGPTAGTEIVDSGGGNTSNFADTGSITGGNLKNYGTIVVHDNIYNRTTSFTLTNVQFSNAGAVTIGDGTTADALTLTGTTVTGSGSITVENAALLYLSGSDTLAGGNLSNFGIVDAEGIADVFNDETVTNSGAIVISGAVSLEGNTSITNLSAADTITVEDSASLTLDNTAAITGGNITVQTGGNLTMDGSADSIGNGTLTNHGTVNADGTGDTLGNETVTNDDAISVAGNLTLDNGTTITNALSTDTITVTGTGLLTLKDTTAITGGNITVLAGGNLTMDGSADSIGNGTLTNHGTVNADGTGDTLGNETVTNDDAISVAGNLTLDNGTTITNALSTDTITVTGTGLLTLKDTTAITGGNITVLAGGNLTMDGSADSIGNGTLTNHGTVNADGTGDTLGNETVTNDDAISVAGNLTLDNGTTITNALSTDTITVTGTGLLTLKDTTAITGGNITVLAGGNLTMDGSADSIGNGTLTNHGTVNADGTGDTLGNETVTNDDAISVAGNLTLDNGTTITNALSTDTITVTGTGLLTLKDTTAITGGNITVQTGGNLTMDGSADSIGNGTLTNHGTVNADGTGDTLGNETVTNDDAISVAGNLTLDNGTTITNALSTDTITVKTGATLILDAATIDGGKVINHGEVEATGGASATTDTIENVASFTNAGTLLLTDPTSNVAGATLVLSNDNLTNTGTIEVGPRTANAPLTLELESTTIAGGTFKGHQHIYVTGGGISTIKNVTDFYSRGKLVVEGSGTTLVLANETLNNLYSSFDGTNGSVVVKAQAILDLQSVTVNSYTDISTKLYGAILNHGILEATAGSNAIYGADITNYSGANLEVTGSGVTLTIGQNSTVTNSAGGAITVGDGTNADTLTLSGSTITGAGSITIDDLSTLSTTGIDRIGGGNLTNSGSISDLGNLTLSSETVTNSAGGTITVGDGTHVDTLTVTGSTVTGAGAITVKANATLSAVGIDSIAGGTLTNSGTIVDGGNVTLASEYVSNSGSITVAGGHTLNMAGANTISGGTINNIGLIEATSGSNTISGATITNPSTIEANGGTLIIDPSSVTNTGTLQATNGGTLEISGNTTVTNSGAGKIVANTNSVVEINQATIIGGAITGSGNITIGGDSELKNVDLNGTHITVSGGTLMLDNVTLTGDLTNSGTLTVTELVLSDATITGGSIKNNGTIEVLLSSEIENDKLTNTGHTVQVDSGQTLTISGDTINGGTINDGTSLSGATIDVTGNSTIENANLNYGGVSVAAGVTLTLDGTTVTGNTITQLNTTTTTGTVKVDSGKTLTLAGADTITGGAFAFALGPPLAAAGNSVFYTFVSIGDLNPGDPSVTVTIQASSGSFAAISGSGLTVHQSGDEVTITGLLSDVNAALANGITYTPAGTSNTLTLSVTDGSDTAFRTIDINTSVPGSPTTTNISASGEITNAGLIDIAGMTTLNSDVVFNGGGTVKVEATDVLQLDDTKIYNGTITDDGKVEIAGLSAIVNASLNMGTGGQLTISPTATLELSNATITGGSINNTGIIEVGISSEIRNDVLTNTGATVKVDSDETLTVSGDTIGGGTISLLGTGSTAGAFDVIGSSTLDGNVSVSGGQVTVAGGQILTLDGAVLENSVVTNAGTIATTSNGGAINNAIIDNASGTLSTGGTFTLDDTTVNGGILTGNHSGVFVVDSGDTLTLNGVTAMGATGTGVVKNSGTITLNSGLTISGSSFTLELTNSGTVTINGHTIVGSTAGETLENSGNTIAGAGQIGDGSGNLTLSNAGGIIASASLGPGLTTLTIDTGATILNSAILEAGNNSTLIAVDSISGSGELEIGNQATLQLDGSDGGEQILFLGNSGSGPSGGTLTLDDTSGGGAADTIKASSSTKGAFLIDGPGNVTTASGDAIDFTSTGGTSGAGNGAALTVSLSGAITGAAAGIVVTQEGVGNINITTSGDVVGDDGSGIAAIIHSGSTEAGSISVSTGDVTGNGTGAFGIDAEIDNGSGGNISVTAAGNVTGNQFGILASTHGDGDISITAGGSGTTLTSDGSGIIAVNQDTGSFGNVSSTIDVKAYGTIESGSDLNVNSNNAPGGIEAGFQGASAAGTVTVDNFANITAGNGSAIVAFFDGPGSGNITVIDEAGTTISGNYSAVGAVNGTAPDGILANNKGTGDIAVTVEAASDHIYGGSVGILAINEASVIAATAASAITVTARGTITAGDIETDQGNAPAGILAGFEGGSVDTANANVTGNIKVYNYADVTAAAGDGIRAFDFGYGCITINNEAGATASGLVGIRVISKQATDTIAISNAGTIKGLGDDKTDAVVVISQKGGSANIYNTGTIAATTASPSAIAIYESGGTLSVTNSGMIIGSIIADATIDIKSGGVWDVAGTNSFSGATNSIVNAGTINIEGENSFTSSGTLTFANTGTINVVSGGIENSSLTNTGHINFNGLGEDLTGVSVTNGNGTITVSAGAAVTLGNGTAISGGNLSNAGNITDAGNVTLGNLTLTQNSNSAFTIAALAVLTLNGIDSVSGGNLSNDGSLVDDGNVTLGNLTLTGNGTVTVNATDALMLTGNDTFGGGNLSNAGNVTDEGNATFGNLTLTQTGNGTVTVNASDALMLTGNDTFGGGNLSNAGSITDEGNASFGNLTLTQSGSGTLTVAHSAALTFNDVTINGTISNFGAISVDNTLSLPAADTLTLDGNGTVTLDGATIRAVASGAILDNVSNTISGDGQIGTSGDKTLTLKNDAAGIIDADVSGQTLLIDTGNAVTNAGMVEATNGGILKIDDNVAGAGNATISSGGMLELGGSDAQTVTFDDASTLKLDGTSDFTGTVKGLAIGDIIDLAGIGSVTTASFNGSKLTVNGTAATFTISGLPNADAFYFTPDGASGTDFTVEAAPTVTINATTFAAGGFTISGTASDADVNVNGQTVTVDIVNSSDVVVYTAPATVAGGDWSLPISSSEASSLAGGNYTVTANLTDWVTSPASENLAVVAVVAGWTGQTLDEYYFYPNKSTTYYTSPTFVAPASGIEGNPDFGGAFSIAVSNSSITASHFTFNGTWVSATFNGFEIADLSGNPDISGVAIDSSTNMAGLTAADITFDSNAIFVNWAGLSFTTATVVKLDITFDPPVNPSVVPVAQTLNGSSSPANVASTVTVADSTALALAGTIDNTATIAVDGATAATALAINGAVTLQGGGQIELSQSNENYIFGNGTLVNVDNTISGGGDIGDGSLGFTNSGLVEALGPYALIIDTGTDAFVNTGTLESKGGSLIVDSAVTGGGNVLILGGSVEFAAASDNDVIFSSAAVGLLALDQAQSFTGQISGFAAADEIDLGGLAFSASATLSYTANTNGSGGVLTISDGGEAINLTMTGNYTDASFALASDGHGGTMVTATTSLPASGSDPVAVLDNTGTMTVNDGATLPLGNTIDNSGTIVLNSTGDHTELQIVGDAMTLEGGGQLTLSDNSANSIVASSPGTTLTNVDNTISGAGVIGSGNADLTLVNEAHGTIDADADGGILTIDTGNAIINTGLLEATNGGTLLIDDAVSGGNAVIAGGILDFAAAANVNVTFDNGTGVPVYGELVLGDATDFSGQIAGFSGTAPNASHSDVVDLSGFAFTATTFAEAVSNGNLVLTVTDGSEVSTLTFDNFTGTLDFASNGNGGTLIYDPPASGSVTDPAVVSTATGDSVSGAISLADANPNDTFTDSATPDGSNYAGGFSLGQPVNDNGHVAVDFNFTANTDQMNVAPGQTVTQSYDVSVAEVQNPAENTTQTVSVTVGGPGDDNFVFAPGIGADTVTNFNPQQDTIELDHFGNAQTVQELQALITTDVHGDAVINLGHNDSVTLAGVTETQLQHIIQAGHVLLH